MEADPPVPDPTPARRPSEGRDFTAFLVKLALFVILFRSFVAAPFSIPSESMLPRLLIGDYLIVAKYPYGWSRYSLPFGVPLIPGRILAHDPQRGDVVVFKAPPGNSEDYIKRVIGLPGDLVQVKGGQPILNGAPLPRKRIADFVFPESPNSPCFSAEFRAAGAGGQPLCRYPRYQETLPGGRSYDVLDLGPTPADNTDVTVVPQGRLFLMGDNRDRSADSRFPAVPGQGIGLVPEENLVGRATVSVFSTDGSANWFLPWTWVTAARWKRAGELF